jgi:hypothetical protein
MTLDELKKALDQLIAEGIDPDEPVAIEYYGSCLEINSITVVVVSELWEPQTVLITADLIEDENKGEADDG